MYPDGYMPFLWKKLPNIFVSYTQNIGGHEKVITKIKRSMSSKKNQEVNIHG